MGLCQPNVLKGMIIEKISYSSKILGAFIFISIILTAMVFYCIVNLIRAFVFFQKRKEEKENKRKRALAQSSSTSALLSNENDNEEYTNSQEDPKQHAEAQDDYYKFQDSINKSLSAYKNYNEKLQGFFKSTRSIDAPDQYDTRIFNKSDDNW